jgi:hypothetical protein
MEETKKPSQSTLPKPQDSDTSFYCCEDDTDKLHRANLLTGEQSCHEVPKYKFQPGCRLTGLPGGSLLFTGGAPELRMVEKIHTLREFAVSAQPPMHREKCFHAAVYHSQCVYVLGRSECERYVCTESRWEVLPVLPVAGICMSAVEYDNSLYALGGSISLFSKLDTVQRLRLDSLTWELMQLKLPQAAFSLPCFKVDTQVYLVIEKTLYSFTPLEVKPLRTLPESILSYSSSYSRGTLYYEDRGIKSLVLGELTRL